MDVYAKEKIKVAICTGTTCYMMGGSELLLLVDYLSPEMLDRVEIAAVDCFGFCGEAEAGKSPFVTVNGERLEQATIQSVTGRIRELLC
jgi:NADH:ubiquinone oxidoreductase subunit E